MKLKSYKEEWWPVYTFSKDLARKEDYFCSMIVETDGLTEELLEEYNTKMKTFKEVLHRVKVVMGDEE